jgi:hypothetical protein
MSSEPLACPRCASTHGLEERFCPTCGMPLVYAGADALQAPPTGGRNQAEAEFIQGLLLEEGVPSLLRRARGFDVPDYLAAGPRDVFVPESGAATARDVLLQSDLAPTAPAAGIVSPARVLAGVLAAFVLVAIVAWVGTEIIG